MTFDESLPKLVALLKASLGKEPTEAGTVLRDATGCLAFFSASPLEPAQTDRLRVQIFQALGRYARPDRVVVAPDEPGARRVLEATPCTVRVDDVVVRLLDRRIVGADWLTPPRGAEGTDDGAPDSVDVPAEALASPRRTPRFVFASLKGGVGRSTALAVVAAQLAERGRNILVVDLDLEAPGVGSLLLATTEKPALGSLDYLVELNFGAVVESLDGFIGSLTTRGGAGGGVVDVVPVAGSRSDDAPENYMAKLARAMTEAVPADESAQPMSFAGKVRVMLEAMETRRRYDVVLVDARAGLAELAAGPLLALDADVLLFGTAQQQTLDGLRFLFAHLSTLVPPGVGSPWESLKMVHAKASTEASTKRFREELWELFGEYLYEAEGDAPFDALNFDADDNDAPHSPLVVPLEVAFHDWNPFNGSPLASYFDRTFGDIRRYVETRLQER